MSGNPKHLARLVLATLIAPVTAAAIGCALLAMIMAPELVFQTEVYSGEYRSATLREIATSLFGFSLIGASMGVLLGWPTMLVGGLPVHRWLVQKGRTGGLTYSLIGILVGTGTMLVYFLATGSLRDPRGLIEFWPILLSGPVTGFLAAGLFWCIRRPDRIVAA